MKIKETGCTANQFSAKQPTVKQQIKSLKDITDKSCQERRDMYNNYMYEKK